MTTVRDWLNKRFARLSAFPSLVAGEFLDDLLSPETPESVRLELAGMLNPWMPIETAVMDGKTWVEVCNPEYGPNPVIARGLPHGGWIDLTLRSLPTPTHWRPRPILPAPPSEDKP